MFRGLSERIKHDIKQKLPKKSIKVKVVADQNRKNCVWAGAAAICDMTSFRSNWMTLKQYHEHGSAHIHQKCLL